MTPDPVPDKLTVQSVSRVDHAGHRIVVRTPDMAGRPVVICATCNVRLADA